MTLAQNSKFAALGFGGLLLALLSSLVWLNIACAPSGVRFVAGQEPFERLSEYGFFDGKLAALAPADGVLPYQLNTALFTDYAFKARFVWMPDGTTAQYDPNEVFDFPEGAVLIKNFYYPADFREPERNWRIIETRLLIRQPNGWEPVSYIWDDAQTEAKRSYVGGQTQVAWVHYDGKPRETKYVIPNKNQCAGCHRFNSKIMPIGPKARNLNGEMEYPTGNANQLTQWASLGYLSGLPDLKQVEAVPMFDDPKSGTVETRARAWLDINCAHCHRYEGPAGTTGYYLTWHEQNLDHLGICKPPIAAGLGSGGRLYAVVPGHPDASILDFRIQSTDPEKMMPELGRSLVHDEGVAAVRAWIQSLPTAACSQTVKPL